MTTQDEAQPPVDEGAIRRTLFDVRLTDARARRQVAGERGRGRVPGRRATSDVRRFRNVVGAAGVAVVAVAVAYWRVPPAPTPSTGALALPHRAAGLTCESCHVDDGAAADRCVGCHGPHRSTRAAHRRLAAAGTLGCVVCHDVHGTDQGVRFEAGPPARAVRYGVAGTSSVEAAVIADATVPFVPLSQCAACHDPTGASDPIRFCFPGGAEPPAAVPTVCFDEHQELGQTGRAEAGVCGAQHAPGRAAVWEAAREVAAALPVPPAGGRDDALWWWLGAGVLGALLGFAGTAGGDRLWRRRLLARRPPAPMKAAERQLLPQIDETTCLGCYACVDACPYDVLTIERYVAVVTRPEACCGLTLCEQVCPNGSLVITAGEPIGHLPDLTDDLESTATPGVYLAGDITGVPLIKNAIGQGSTAVDRIAGALPSGHGFPLDLLVVGAGPAGISAALRAKELGLRCAVIEQGSVAQSIRSFPRGKLVFDQPLALPVIGKLWLEEATKEELLAKWLRLVERERLTIHEGQRFVGLSPEGRGFEVEAERVDGDARISYRAARVLLAVGTRGAPRTLAVELSAEAESKVFYHLADARSFAGQRVLVVGLGDVAMETAIALARQPGTEVTVAYRGPDFSRGKARNIDELRRLQQIGRVQMLFDATVTAVEGGEVRLQVGDEPRVLGNDVVFVMIGSEPPAKLLARAGVRLRATVDADRATRAVV